MSDEELHLPTDEIIQGDATKRLHELPESSVHCVVTSPPYFGMRDYGVEDQIGLEDELGEYITELVGLGRELGRVLRPDGSWWLNLGDAYNGNSGSRSGGMNTHVDDGYEDQLAPGREESGVSRRSASQMGMQRRCKMLIPHRVAIALIDDGWIVRNDAVWAKKSSMPESVKNRLSTTFEYFFHLVPDEDYWYDLDAIREPYSEATQKRMAQNSGEPVYDGQRDRGHPTASQTLDIDDFTHPNGKNPGDVLRYSPARYEGAHCAVMPLELAKLPIRATCPPIVCADCETPYERMRDAPSDTDEPNERATVSLGNYDDTGADEASTQIASDGGSSDATGADTDASEEVTERTVDGVKWRSVCSCDTEETHTGVVLDPFAGVGTTLLAGRQLDRRFTGIELNEEYISLAQARIGLNLDDASFLREDDQLGFEAF